MAYYLLACAKQISVNMIEVALDCLNLVPFCHHILLCFTASYLLMLSLPCMDIKAQSFFWHSVLASFQPTLLPILHPASGIFFLFFFVTHLLHTSDTNITSDIIPTQRLFSVTLTIPMQLVISPTHFLSTRNGKNCFYYQACSIHWHMHSSPIIHHIHCWAPGIALMKVQVHLISERNGRCSLLIRDWSFMVKFICYFEKIFHLLYPEMTEEASPGSTGSAAGVVVWHRLVGGTVLALLPFCFHIDRTSCYNCLWNGNKGPPGQIITSSPLYGGRFFPYLWVAITRQYNYGLIY